MEGSNLILNNWLHQKEIFNDNLIICRKRPTKNAVHDLRVAVKKMRSYLRLKQQLAGNEWKESFSKILALFKSFGRSRDYDMSLTLVRKLERKRSLSCVFFKEYLSVNRSLTRKWAKQTAIKFNELELEILNDQFRMTESTNMEVCEKIIQLSASKIKKVKNLTRHFHTNAHEIRKQLKDLCYWLKICPKAMTENFINMKTLDTTLNHLGHFQDHFILRKKVNQYIKDLAKKSEERKILKDVEKGLENDQKEILNKAIKKWKEVEIKKATRSVAFSAPDPDINRDVSTNFLH